MGNGVSGKASANLKAIYLEVNGQKQKASVFLHSGFWLCSVALKLVSLL